MGVINASQAKPGNTTSIQGGLVSRFVGWVEGLFGHSSTPAAHGEYEDLMTYGHSRGDSPIDPQLMEFGWDKTGGWDRRKKGGWSPHGDEGMK